MSQRKNEFDQPIGAAVLDWTGAQPLTPVTLNGQACTISPLAEEHLSDLYAAFTAPGHDGMWTYMPVGPFADFAALRHWFTSVNHSTDPMFHAIIAQDTGKAVGFASFLRINPDAGSVEVGFIAYSPLLKRTKIATEAMFLMMRHVFDLGYRRYEWKCDALNAPSRRAAARYGFSYEGTFRQALVYKGRNRDTAWFSILDAEWPTTKAAYAAWLDPMNFDSDGQQRQKLQDLIKAHNVKNP